MSGIRSGTILAVDRNPRNLELLIRTLADGGFTTLAIQDLARLDAMLADGLPVVLALVDVDGFDADIWERCRQLHDRHAEILVLVGRRAIPLAQVRSACCGARAVLSKPLSPKVLTELVRGVMETSS